MVDRQIRVFRGIQVENLDAAALGISKKGHSTSSSASPKLLRAIDPFASNYNI